MSVLSRLVPWGLLGCLVLAGLGCHRDAANAPGVAATVNGEPISVAALEARHDLSRLAVPVADNPAVEELRAQYGAVLADMIVARLAGQELARRHLAVTEAEAASAEATIRADYPGETFASMLVEERIDLERWREALRDHLTVAKFAREVLGPSVRVGVTEAADYYKEHIADFTRPARSRFLLVRAGKAEAAKAVLAAYRKSSSRASLEGRPGVTVQEVTAADRSLAASWREALAGLKAGEASPVMTDATGATVLVLLDRQGETVLEPAKAYAQVEALLSGRKLEAAMAAWLAEALPKARIRVNSLLVATAAPAASPAGGAPETEATSAPDVAAGSATDQPAVAPTAAAPPPSAPAIAAPVPPAASAMSQPAPAAAQVATPASGQSSAPSATASAVSPPPVAGPGASETATAAAQAPAVPAPEAAGAPAPAAAEPTARQTLPAPTEPRNSGIGQEAVASPAAPTPAAAAAAATAPQADSSPGLVEFTAVKASWILATADDGQEERTYLKPGKPLRLAFTHRLSVRLGSPSDVSYRYGNRQETVVVGKKESRVLEFP